MDESLKRWLQEELSGQVHAGEEEANTPDLDHLLEQSSQWTVPNGQTTELAWQAFQKRLQTEANVKEAEPTLDELMQDPALQQMLAVADSLELPQTQSPVDAWHRLQHRIDAEKSDKVPAQPTRVLRMTPTVRWASIAAALALLLVAYFITRNPEPRTVLAAAGETKTLTLPDGSILELNAASSVSFNPATWDEARRVKLEGEGFFQVEKGAPFTVETSFGEVQVLGTSFNVQARKDNFSVACYTGKVAVKRQNAADTHILLPGTFVNNSEAETPQTFTDEKESLQPEWMKGKFTFVNASFRLVLDEVERQFDLEIEAEGIEGRTFTGTFYNRDLLAALNAVCNPMQMVYAEESGVVVLRQASD